MRRKLGKLSYLLATVLVVGLLGGVAVADGKIGSKRIKNNAVKSRHIDDGTIRQRDLRSGVRAKLDRTGQQGPQGPAGEQGPQGEPGADGVSGHEVVNSPAMVFGPNGWGGWDCPEGKVAVGGGSQGAPVASSRPHEPGDVLPHLPPDGATAHGWSVQATNDGGEITVFVVCASIAG
jgi:hypothetical protein